MAHQESLDMSQLNEIKTQEQQLKEKHYQQAFEELSSVRSELRVARQQNLWLKNAKTGLQQEIQALHDILQQKKAIISKMSQQMQDRVYQLDEADRQITDLLHQNEILVTELEKAQSDVQELQKQVNEQQQKISQQDVMLISTSQPPLTDKAVISLSASNSEKKSQKQKSPVKEDIVLPRLNQQITKTVSYLESICQKPKTHRSFNMEFNSPESSITIGFDKLLTLNDQLIISCESFRKELEVIKLSQREVKKQSTDIKQQLFQAQKNQILLREQEQKSKAIARQLGQRVNWLQQEKQRNTKQYQTENSQLIEKLNHLQKQKQQIQRQSNWLPILKPFLPEGLPELVRQLLRFSPDEPRTTILQKQIEKLSSLQLCQQKHNETLEQNYKHTKGQLVRIQGQNEILQIKLANLERAYEHAIDDYRRAIRFGTAKSKRVDFEQSSGKHKSSIWASNKENRNWNQ